MTDYSQALIDSLSDELVVIDRNFQIKWANATVRSRWNKAESCIGQPCHLVTGHPNPCESAGYACPVPAVLNTGEPVRVTHWHPDGDRGNRCVEIIASPVRDMNGEVHEVVELMRDVTEAEEMRETLVRRNRELSALNAIAEALSSSLRSEQILSTALDAVLRLTGVEVGAIFVAQDQSDELTLAAHRGTSQEAAEAMIRFHQADGACGGAAASQRPRLVLDVSRYRGAAASSLKKDNLHSIVDVPLIANGTAIGSLCVGTRARRDFCPEEVTLLSAIASQIAVALENARLYSEVARKEHIRGELLRQVISAQEDERKRIARGLHDRVSQALTALLYTVETAVEIQGPEGHLVLANRMRQLLQGTLEEVYELILNLRPSLLDHLGLVPAVQSYAERNLEAAGVRVHLEQNGTPRRLPSPVETAVYRVVQEALCNVVQHAAAGSVYITFDFQDHLLSVTVEDDGIGFDVAEVEQSKDIRRGLGLLGMRERMELVGGEFVICSEPGKGTTMITRVPLPAVTPEPATEHAANGEAAREMSEPEARFSVPAGAR
jgi:signal transduction histidine kinase